MFDLEEELKKLPDKPGVYIMHDKIGTIIYVGKAVSLKNRLRQYFRPSTNHSAKIKRMVSEKMNELGRSHQIICITHLPQIAAMADTHFLIEKSVENDTTVSHIHELSDEESVQELARMLGGVEITDKVVENAREMKKMAYMKK